MITTMERIEKSRRDRGLRDLTKTEISEILTTGYYDEEKYMEEPMTAANTPEQQPKEG